MPKTAILTTIYRDTFFTTKQNNKNSYADFRFLESAYCFFILFFTWIIPGGGCKTTEFLAYIGRDFFQNRKYCPIRRLFFMRVQLCPSKVHYYIRGFFRGLSKPTSIWLLNRGGFFKNRKQVHFSSFLL